MKSLWRRIFTLTAVIGALTLGRAYAQEHGHASGGQAMEHAEEAVGHAHHKAEAHGGTVAMTQAFHFETVFLPDEIRVYAYDAKQNPIALPATGDKAVKGTVEFQFRDASRKPSKLDLKAPAPAKGAMESMEHEGMQHMEGMREGQHHAAMTMHADESTSPTKLPELYSCPMHPDQVAKTMNKCPVCGMKMVAQGYLSAKADLKEIKPDEARATFHLANLPNDKERKATFTQKITLAKSPAASHVEHGAGAHAH